MAVNLDILVGRPWSGLGGAYARAEPEALRWFPADWRDPEAWRERARQVDERFDRAARERAVRALRAPTAVTRERLDRVASGEGFLVTTGQQPGLFAGPWYTVHKALTAIALADRLERLLDVPVIPVFWVASEDHDWAEVDHVDLLGIDNEPHRLRLTPPPGAGDRPLHRLPLGEDLDGLLAEFADLLPRTEFTPGYLDLLRSAWPPGTTLPEGVQATLAGLLGEHGLAFVDAADPELKAASTPVLEAAVRDAESLEDALSRRTIELREAGWDAQVAVLEGGVNLFLEDEGGRERLYRHDGGFRLRRSEAVLTETEVLTRLRVSPDTVSPNVFLRPVVEAAALPTLGYVAGPGEAAYHAQLAPLFAGHGVPQPLVVPRLSAMLVEGKVGKVLEKLDLAPEALARPAHELAAELAREEVPPSVRAALGELRGALNRGTGTLVDAAREVDPTLKGPIQHARSVALDALGEAERKIVQAVKRQSETRLQQIEKARVNLFPNGVPQERALNPFQHLVRYGPELLDDLRERFARALAEEIGAPAESVAPPGGRG